MEARVVSYLVSAVSCANALYGAISNQVPPEPLSHWQAPDTGAWLAPVCARYLGKLGSRDAFFCLDDARRPSLRSDSDAE